MKIPDCDRCLLYAHNPYLVCGVHPSGVDSDRCPDFRPDPNAEIEVEGRCFSSSLSNRLEEKWCPEGYSWYGDELIANRPSRYTPEQQLQILDSHPFFTGVCPNCGHKFDKSNPPKVHWDCPNPDCDWMDDSIH